MRSLIGLKNIILFSAVLLTIGSVSAQQAFGGSEPLGPCEITLNQMANIQIAQGAQETITKEITCEGQIDAVNISSTTCLFNTINLQNEDPDPQGIDFEEVVTNQGNTSEEHCIVVFQVKNLLDETELVTQQLWINVPEDKPIGGTSFPVSTTSLLVAGFQANMGLWSLALVGIVGAGAAIIYKTKSKKTKQ